MSDIDTAAADSLKALDLEWPIREADIAERGQNVRLVPEANIKQLAGLLDHFVGCGEQDGRYGKA